MRNDKGFLFKQWMVGPVLAVVLGLLLIGCGGPAAPQPGEAGAEPAEVTVQLAWVHSAEYVGFYMAQEKGYYAEENLTVTLEELGEKGPIERVASGEVEFGINSVDKLLLARAAGTPVVGVATLYQRSPIAYISLAESGINQPQDLIGKTVIVDFDGTTGIVYEALLKQQDISLEQVNSLPRTDFSNEPLLSGEADVLDAFITNQPVQLATEGYEVNAILPSDYGIDIYANVIFTNGAIIANQPDLVERFLRATMRGIESAVAEPETAAQLAVDHNESLNLDSELESLRRSIPLLNPADTAPGMMNRANWETAQDILLEQELLNELELDQAYDLTFLEKLAE